MKSTQETGYILVNQALIILGNSLALHQWLPEEAFELTGQQLTNVFPMLIGYEDQLEELIQQQRTEPIIISQIGYHTTAEGNCYFNLQVERCNYAEVVLLVTIADVTESTRLEQALLQERNELRLQISERSGRNSQPCQKCLSCQHEPRITHPAQRHFRVCTNSKTGQNLKRKATRMGRYHPTQWRVFIDPN